VVELLGQGGAVSGGTPRDDIDLSQARLAVLGRLRRIDITAEDAEALRKEIKARVEAAKESPDADSAPNTFAIWKVGPAEAPKETTGDA
jgi:hypothetical protein